MTQLDVAASLIEMAGGKLLENSDGRSLVPLIKIGKDSAQANQGKEVIFSEVVGYSMVFDGRFKLAVDTATQAPVEMFDLQEDPKELTNFVNHPEYEEVRKRLLEKHLQNFRKRLDISTLKELEKVRVPQDSSRLLKMLQVLKEEKYLERPR